MTVQLATALGGPTPPILENDDSSPMDHSTPDFERNIFGQRLKKKLDTDLELVHLLPAAKVKHLSFREGHNGLRLDASCPSQTCALWREHRIKS